MIEYDEWAEQERLQQAAATVRVKRGARWLDENFPGWESRINTQTLSLSSGNDCICGQVFKEEAKRSRGFAFDPNGYAYAENHLFAQANSWISSLVRIRAEGETPKSLSDWEHDKRVERVAIALGFNCGSVGTNRVPSDQVYVSYWDLQVAWEELLKERASA